MAKLTRKLDGSYVTNENKNVGDLDAAASRGSELDKKNVDYATKNYGYKPPAGYNSGISNVDPMLPTTQSLAPEGVPEPENESDIFNLMTRDALTKFQGVNTADLEKKKRALQQAAIGKSSEITDEDLRTFSPAQQANIRAGNIKALQPEFDDVAYKLNKAQQSTTNFENTFEKVMAINAEYAEKIVAPEAVIENYKELIEADPQNVNTYLAKVNDKTREAILGVLDYSKMSPKEETTKAPSIDDQLKAMEAGYDIGDDGLLVKKPPEILTETGAIGGQCGDYLHKIAGNIPAMGDTFEEKMRMANMSTANYEVGDVLIQKTNQPYGHVSIVKSVDGDTATVIESNYGLDEKVGERTIKMGDPSIQGVYRGAELKEPEADDKIDEDSKSILIATGLSLPAFGFLTRGTNALTRMSADQRLQYMGEAEEYLNRTGTDVATFQSQYNALSKTVEANSLRNNQAEVAETELIATVDNLRTAADEAEFKKLKLLNVAKLFAGKELNDDATIKYSFHLQQLREEFAMYNMAIAGQLDSNGNIREINESDYRKAESIIANGIAKGSLDGFENALVASMEKMKVVLADSIEHQDKKVWELFGVGDSYQGREKNEETIRVQLISSGETGTIPANEFDASIYKKL